MLQEHNKAVIPDLNGKHDVGLEVNWRTDLDRVVRISLGDKEAVIPMRELYGFVFVAADAEQQMEMLPVRKTTITKYVRQHKVKAKEAIRPGQELVVNCEIDVPTIVQDGLRKDIFGNKKKSSLII